MPSIKVYNVKLKSLKNTKKITKTMKMVSASKLKKAQEAQVSAKLYAHRITELIGRVGLNITPDLHPLLLDRNREARRALILVYTSDKGLCGAFNHNAHKEVASWIKNNGQTYETIEMSFCGKRGHNFFRRRARVRSHYDDVTINPDFQTAMTIGSDIIRAYVSDGVDEVYLAYNQFFSPLSQKTIFEKVLPIDPRALKPERPDIESEQTDKKAEYIFEPEAREFLEYLIPHFLYFKIYFALLENAAGEHGARMSAMDNATKNASELIDKYTLLRNRARQAQITTELTEIVAGAESLK